VVLFQALLFVSRFHTPRLTSCAVLFFVCFLLLLDELAKKKKKKN
jgi:hypothetical protein